MSVFRKFDLNLIPSAGKRERVAQVAKVAKVDRSCATFATFAGGGRANADVRHARLAVVPDLSDPEDIRAWLHERAAMREDSGARRTDADNAVFDELLWIWHAANPVKRITGQCAACGTTLGPPVMALEGFSRRGPWPP